MAFTIKDVEDIVDDIIINIVENVDGVTDANIGAVMRQFIESVALEMEDIYTQLQTIYDGTRIDTATGDDLDQLGKLVGVLRRTGTKALGDVTFIRNSISGSDFTISQGLIVSTQPNTGDTQLRFTVSTNTTFSSSITHEAHEYKDGIFDYKLDERFIGDTSNIVITGTTSSVATTFSNTSDYNVISNFDDFVVDVGTIEVVDECDTADFTEGDDAQACTVSVDKKHGTYSLNLGKNLTTSTLASYTKALSSTKNGSNKDLGIWLNISDSVELAKIKNINLWIASGGTLTNSYKFVLKNSSLETGWKMYRLLTSSSTTIQNGTPSLNSINYIKIEIECNNSTDTITLGNVKMDYWIFADTETYKGDIIRWLESDTFPDDGTDFEVDYKPLSKEVECVAEEVGADYNVNKEKINYQVSNIPNINSVSNYDVMSGGSDEEIDSSLRERILFATELQGKATAESIRQAILNVNGVASCSITDKPLSTTTNEPHVFSSGTSKYKLSQEVLYLDGTIPSNIDIKGTVSGSSDHLFVYGTDYVEVYDSNGIITSEIEWQNTGTNPDDATLFFADYEYNWLGHATAFVSGVENPIPSTVSDNINAAILESRAAGIQVDWSEPTIISQDVTATITVDTGNGFTSSDVIAEVTCNIRDYINALGVGDDVFVAELYNVIQSTDGVLNSAISSPAADVTIGDDEIAKAGTITIT